MKEIDWNERTDRITEKKQQKRSREEDERLSKIRATLDQETDRVRAETTTCTNILEEIGARNHLESIGRQIWNIPVSIVERTAEVSDSLADQVVDGEEDPSAIEAMNGHARVRMETSWPKYIPERKWESPEVYDSGGTIHHKPARIDRVRKYLEVEVSADGEGFQLEARSDNSGVLKPKHSGLVMVRNPDSFDPDKWTVSIDPDETVGLEDQLVTILEQEVYNRRTFDSADSYPVIRKQQIHRAYEAIEAGQVDMSRRELKKLITE